MALNGAVIIVVPAVDEDLATLEEELTAMLEGFELSAFCVYSWKAGRTMSHPMQVTAVSEMLEHYR